MNSLNIKSTAYRWLIAGLIMPVLILAGTAGAQVNNELDREYISPEEMVSLSKNMKFDEAVDLLNEYAQRYTGRFIVDRTNTTEEIGIPINYQYWKEVLQYMADVKGLQIVETPRFLEIIEGEQTGAPEGTGKQEMAKEIDFSSREVRIKAIFFEGNKP